MNDAESTIRELEAQLTASQDDEARTVVEEMVVKHELEKFNLRAQLAAAKARVQQLEQAQK